MGCTNPTKKSSISKSSMTKSSSRILQQWKDQGMYKIVLRFKVFYWGNSFLSFFFIQEIILLKLNKYLACMIITNVYVEHVENIAIKLLQLSQSIWLYF